MMRMLYTLLFIVLSVSCFKEADVCTELGEPYYKDFTLVVENETSDSIIARVFEVLYQKKSDNFGENGIIIGSQEWNSKELIVEDGDTKLTSINYFFSWTGDDGTTREQLGRVNSFMIEFEFESGDKISYWGLPQECDVIGYGADYYGIAYVSKDTGGLYTIYDEDNRFANFALKAVINSEDDIEISVDYENSVIIESNE